MNAHRLTQEDARRPVAAALILVATGLGCLWIGTYTKRFPFNDITQSSLARSGTSYTPNWVMPVAVTVGIAGLAVALLILRLYRTTR